MHNHWGVRVMTTREVDKAYEYLTAHKVEYKLGAIGKPTWSHGSYSCYFVEPGTNGWEIECYEDFSRKESAAEKFGGVKKPHWENIYPEERFPGRGYVPQGFTHGTLVSRDLNASRDFYTNVLDLEVHRFRENVIYVKHPSTRTYIVCALRKEFKVFSPNFRNTLAVESKDAVKRAYREFSSSGEALGVMYRPRSAILASTSGARSARVTSSNTLRTIGCGRSAGPTMPNHTSKNTPG